jgi:hypothetical protein
MQLGRYTVTFAAQELSDGQFEGTASVVWEEADATREALWRFRKRLPTGYEAIEHARAVILRLHDDGKLV